MGVVVNDELKDWQVKPDENTFDPFEQQIKFFRLATGIQTPVYTKIEPTGDAHTDKSKFNVNQNSDGSYNFSCVDSNVSPQLQWDFKVPKSGLVLMGSKITKGDDITILRNGTPQRRVLKMDRLSIGCAGYFKKGETASIRTNLEKGVSGNAKLYVYMLNQDVFEKGYNLIKENVMETTYFENGGKLEGTINCNRDGLFYTSIPYEAGWKAYVDGEEVEIKPIGNCMLSFDITKGEHEIVLKYLPNGFIPGLIVSILCLMGFAALCAYAYIKKKKVMPDWSKDAAYLGIEKKSSGSSVGKRPAKEPNTPKKQELPAEPVEDVVSDYTEPRNNKDIPFNGSTLFFVASIIMTIGGVLSILINIINMRTSTDTSVVINLLASILQVSSGVFGLINHNKYHDPNIPIGLGIATIFSAILSNLMAGNWLVFIMPVWHVLYIIGAVLNKKQNK